MGILYKSKEKLFSTDLSQGNSAKPLQHRLPTLQVKTNGLNESFTKFSRKTLTSCFNRVTKFLLHNTLMLMTMRIQVKYLGLAFEAAFHKVGRRQAVELEWHVLVAVHV